MVLQQKLNFNYMRSGIIDKSSMLYLTEVGSFVEKNSPNHLRSFIMKISANYS